MTTPLAKPPSLPPLTPRPSGHPGYSTTLARVEQSVSVARLAVCRSLECWGIGNETRETAVTIVSELFTNAVVHGTGTSARLIIERPADDQVYVAVVDRAADRLPTLRAPSDWGDGGRGLILVDAMADRWGYDRLGSPRRYWGKCVWAQLLIKAEQ
ncbi:ATP-binding protein [Streptomyces sp. NPDC059092]|uniref:ATP-binding protein n=1 Tax=Streptomyces sp. NPDC059092 TaxID=3346725 RepID=UPI0036A4D2D1